MAQDLERSNGHGLPSGLSSAETVVALIQQAHEWLLQATSITEVQEVRAKAEVIRSLTAQAKLGKEAEQAAMELRLRAERRLGQMIDMAQSQGELAKVGQPAKELSAPMTISDLGLTRNESSQFKQLASIDADDFEDAIQELKADEKLSRAALMARGKEITQSEGHQKVLGDIRTSDRVEAMFARIPKLEAEISFSLGVLHMANEGLPAEYLHLAKQVNLERIDLLISKLSALKAALEGPSLRRVK